MNASLHNMIPLQLSTFDFDALIGKWEVIRDSCPSTMATMPKVEF